MARFLSCTSCTISLFAKIEAALEGAVQAGVGRPNRRVRDRVGDRCRMRGHTWPRSAAFQEIRPMDPAGSGRMVFVQRRVHSVGFSENPSSLDTPKDAERETAEIGGARSLTRAS